MKIIDKNKLILLSTDGTMHYFDYSNKADLLLKVENLPKTDILSFDIFK